MWQFREAVRSMSEACRALGVPVISGNVSFYNETEGRNILPTPTVATVGVIPNLGNLPDAGFTRAGDRIVLLGEDRAEFGGSAYLRLLFDVEQGLPPRVDLDAEARLARLLRLLALQGLVHTAHDLSEGGFAVALAEACFTRGLGARVKVPLAPLSLFSETQARAIVAAHPAQLDRVLEAARSAGVPAREIGEVGGGELVIEGDGDALRADVVELRQAWATALPRALDL
jgi:phosphoribosylformylglycinamidine synthase